MAPRADFAAAASIEVDAAGAPGPDFNEVVDVGPEVLGAYFAGDLSVAHKDAYGVWVLGPDPDNPEAVAQAAVKAAEAEEAAKAAEEAAKAAEEAAKAAEEAAKAEAAKGKAEGHKAHPKP